MIFHCPKSASVCHSLGSFELTDEEYADAFNTYGRERMKRVQAARQKKREMQEAEKKMEATLKFFKDLVHVCQVRTILPMNFS